jgi:large subunit ribosomal protein L3
MKFILGKKIGMSQVFDEDGKQIPVTLIEAGPCQILQIKTKDKDGYEAIQIGFVRKNEKKIKKSGKGKEFRYLKEFNIQPTINNEQQITFKVGDKIDVSVFQEGDKVKISGVSKGKGFQGVVKRHGFHGRDATHGVKHEQRKPGSIGSSWPERVIKGRKMPGRMGAERITVSNLKIVKIDKENNLIAVKGAVPGHGGILLEIKG